MKVSEVAKIAHQASKAYCEVLGDMSQADWEEAPDWQKESVENGVLFVLGNPSVSPEASHENWLRLKEKEGWVYGPVKNAEKKEHPCMLPYAALPEEQRIKDVLFCSIVRTLIGKIEATS